MTSESIILSSAGLKNLIIDDDEFVFIIGQRQVCMNKLYADFISPKISQIHRSDPTINSIKLDFQNKEKNSNLEEMFTDEMIQLLQNIASGNSISITKEQSAKMRIISIILGNEELLNKIDEIYQQPFNLSNINNYLQNLQNLYITSEQSENFDFSSYIDNISKNFYLIDEENLMQLPESLFYAIISNDHLKIESEDSLFEIICKYFEKENQNESINIISLLEKVRIEYLSDEKFRIFLQKLNFNEITEYLWQNLCLRFLQDDEVNNLSKNERFVSIGKMIPYDSNNKFKGIINKLTNECGGNVDEKGVVVVTSSSVYNSSFAAKNTVDLDSVQSFFFSNNVPNSWLKYDFKKNLIHPTYYSIRSHTSAAVPSHLRNWVIEGSNDDKNWETIDTRKDDTTLNAFSAVGTFKIENLNDINQFYRYLRIRQIGLNNGSYNYMGISALEFFGRIK